MKFTPDPILAEKAKELAEHAVRMTASAVSPQLDYSEPSVMIVEEILDEIHRGHDDLDDRRILQLGAVFGSYLGEVLRRAHPAEWGTLTAPDGSTFPGMRLIDSDTLIWPWGRAQQRITDGSENNVWHYYRYLTAELHSTP